MCRISILRVKSVKFYVELIVFEVFGDRMKEKEHYWGLKCKLSGILLVWRFWMRQHEEDEEKKEANIKETHITCFMCALFMGPGASKLHWKLALVLFAYLKWPWYDMPCIVPSLCNAYGVQLKFSQSMLIKKLQSQTTTCCIHIVHVFIPNLLFSFDFFFYVILYVSYPFLSIVLTYVRFFCKIMFYV